MIYTFLRLTNIGFTLKIYTFVVHHKKRKTMGSLLITTPNKTDLQLFIDLAKRVGVKASSISDEEILDLGLLNAMSEGKKSKFVPRGNIMEKLNPYGK